MESIEQKIGQEIEEILSQKCGKQIGVRYRLRSQVFFNAKLESNGLPCLSTP